AWVLREGSTNVVRHADARHVWITVSADALVVEDDGRGAGGAGTAGHGLTGLADRAREAGAVLEAGPRPGGGFRPGVRYADQAPGHARAETDAWSACSSPTTRPSCAAPSPPSATSSPTWGSWRRWGAVTRWWTPHALTPSRSRCSTSRCPASTGSRPRRPSGTRCRAAGR